MIVNIVIAVVVLIAALLVFASTRPGTLNISRTTRVNAPADAIFPHVNDFHRWTAWSPYEKRDPAMKKTYSGAASGPGAVYEWAGNGQVGQGRMEITGTSAPTRVAIKVDFLKPFEGHNTAEFTMVPDGGATTVTWHMTGPAAFMAKLMGIFINMDNMIGNDFAVGLANLKSLVEKS